MKGKISGPDKVSRIIWLLFAVTVFGLIIGIRIRLLGLPLERDEGEYAYSGQLMLQGIPPYKLAYNMKFPGVYAAYAAIISIFGESISAIRLGLLLVNAATVLLVFLLGRRLVSSRTGLAAAIAYAVLSASPTVFGFAAHATHFVMLPVLGAMLLLLRQSDKRAAASLFASGLLLGIAVLMKQPGVFFLLFGAIYLLSKGLRRRTGLREALLRGSIFGAAALLPFGITCLLLWNAGVFGKFWFWTVDYARQYGSLVSWHDVPEILAHNFPAAIGANWALWLLAGFGLIAGLRDKATQASTRFLLGFLIFSALALSSGLYFRSHYFIFVLPSVSLLVGIAIDQLTGPERSTGAARFAPLITLAGAVSLPLVLWKVFLFEASPTEACRTIYGPNPFPESIKIADYVRDHTDRNDTIAVLGSEPQIYFYSNRHSATGYIYTYGLMESQRYAQSMQQEMIREVELARPKYVISVQMKISWFRQPEPGSLIAHWVNDYLNAQYEVDGLINIVTPQRTDYYLGDLPKSPPQPGNYILIYRRKTGPPGESRP